MKHSIKKEDEIKYLKGLKGENEKRIVLNNVNIKIGERKKISASDKRLNELQNLIRQWKMENEDLNEGIDIINDQLEVYGEKD